MATMLTIPSGVWIQLPGTDWEVYQDSGAVAFLGDSAVPVLIRRTPRHPNIGGPRPPVTAVRVSRR